MTVKDMLDVVLSREGVFKNVANPFASTDLIVQENIRIMNELINDIVLKNSLSDLLRECTFTTYKGFESGETLNVGDIRYSGKYRYSVVVGGGCVDNPETFGLKPGETGSTADG